MITLEIVDFVVCLVCAFCAGVGCICYLWIRQNEKEAGNNEGN